LDRWGRTLPVRRLRGMPELDSPFLLHQEKEEWDSQELLARSPVRSAVGVSGPEGSTDTQEPLGVVGTLTGSEHLGGRGVAPVPLSRGVPLTGARGDARAPLAATRTNSRIDT